MRNLCYFLLALFLACPSYSQDQPPPETTSRSLFSQSAVEILERQFADTGASYLLLDARSGALLASQWETYEKPIPLGSLVKPFTALAYASAHDFRYPVYQCKGKASGCWHERPHGKLDFVTAVSVSCNSYFRRLAESVTAEQMDEVTRMFGLEAPEANFASTSLIGLGEQWRISPLRMARAYLELVRRKEQPGVAPILEGMRQSALRGTGTAVGHRLKHTDALVKTGTAPCTHAHWAPADGLVLVLVPALQPEILLFVRVHGVTGAKAAETAGSMLRQMQE
ncbi:MAG TPA: penicillin-binding transpeptidase domain-containing protein [Candidatus Acidoferrum sp.]|nr:penicillin-binding transpeptidase domain-containing protein [Candidatus Acidoferrum sp.]